MTGADALQRECDKFNGTYPVGQRVSLLKDDGTAFVTATRSKAEVLSGHTAVIWLEGVRGCYMLDRVSPIVDGDDPHPAGGASIVVIHGPMATGKTRHAQAFMKAYGCDRVIDDWRMKDGRSRPQIGDLVLTTEEPKKIERALPGAVLISITEARMRLGLGRALDYVTPVVGTHP